MCSCTVTQAQRAVLLGCLPPSGRHAWLRNLHHAPAHTARARLPRAQAGDHAGIGCMINSCGSCEYCAAGEEQYCTGW